MCLFFLSSCCAAAEAAGPRGEQNHRPSLQASSLQVSKPPTSIFTSVWGGGAWRVANIDMVIFEGMRRYEIGCWVKRRDAWIAKHRRAMSLLCRDTKYAVRRCDGRNRDSRLSTTWRGKGRQFEPSKTSRLRCP
ncbi:hypothetical protein B0T09DRAFT_122703 [Sordaria sp. MPI-SDFR-AT-0083]|nr:hypothetical protein B0T09DRAFT_122703 [Sordaria sp. MPI-SDFR-AT-0083]